MLARTTQPKAGPSSLSHRSPLLLHPVYSCARRLDFLSLSSASRLIFLLLLRIWYRSACSPPSHAHLDGHSQFPWLWWFHVNAASFHPFCWGFSISCISLLILGAATAALSLCGYRLLLLAPVYVYCCCDGRWQELCLCNEICVSQLLFLPSPPTAASRGQPRAQRCTLRSLPLVRRGAPPQGVCTLRLGCSSCNPSKSSNHNDGRAITFSGRSM